MWKENLQYIKTNNTLETWQDAHSTWQAENTTGKNRTQRKQQSDWNTEALSVNFLGLKWDPDFNLNIYGYLFTVRATQRKKCNSHTVES